MRRTRGSTGRRAGTVVLALLTSASAALAAPEPLGVLGRTGSTPVTVQPVTVQPATVQPAAAISGLGSRLDQILGDSRLAGATSRVVVADASTGEVLYSRNGALRGTPASNVKLVTSAAAMDLLGPGYRFTTSVSRTGRVSNGRLDGNLHLRGTGDPTLVTADYDRMAAAVAATGIRSVAGYLGVDDTWFDGARLGPSWSWDDEQYGYAAQVSALTVAPDQDYDAGAVSVVVRPAGRGARPTVTLRPASSRFTVVNTATTGSAGSSRTLQLLREHGGNRFVVTGSIPAGGAATVRELSMWDPSLVAADIFRAALARHGVRFGATPVLRRGATPAGATTVVTHRSMPLSALLTPFLKLSNNGHAEVLVKAIGRARSGSGSWAAGTAAIRGWLTRNGVPASGVRLDDGSGLSRTDLLTASQIVRVLRLVRSRAWFGTWYAALPVAGRSERLVGGTLRLRMAGTAAANNVHAKTGSLISVSALSGYVTNAAGRRLVFSVLVTGHVTSSVKPVEDAVAVALARSGTSAAAPPTTAGGRSGTVGRDASPAPSPGRSSAPSPAPTVVDDRTAVDDRTTTVDEAQLECSWTGGC